MARTLTIHVSERLAGRFAGVVTAAEIDAAVNAVKSFQPGQTRVWVKTLDHEVSLENGKFRGQRIYAVVDKQDERDQERVVTLLIFKLGQRVETFFPYDGSDKDHNVRLARKQLSV
jgi:hypothetical protein